MEYCEKHIELVTKVQDVDSRSKSNQHRIKEIDVEIKEIRSDNKVLHEMNKNIAVLATNYENTSKKVDCIEVDLKDLKARPIPDISELECDVKELKQKPSKRWDALMSLLITLIVSGIVGFIIGKIVS